MTNQNGWITLTHCTVAAEAMATGFVAGNMGPAIGDASFFLSDVRSIVDQPWGGAEISVHNLHRLQITKEDANDLRLEKIKALNAELAKAKEATCA